MTKYREISLRKRGGRGRVELYENVKEREISNVVPEHLVRIVGLIKLLATFTSRLLTLKNIND